MHSGGSMTGGCVQSRVTNLLSRSREIEESEPAAGTPGGGNAGKIPGFSGPGAAPRRPEAGARPSCTTRCMARKSSAPGRKHSPEGRPRGTDQSAGRVLKSVKNERARLESQLHETCASLEKLVSQSGRRDPEYRPHAAEGAGNAGRNLPSPRPRPALCGTGCPPSG